MLRFALIVPIFLVASSFAPRQTPASASAVASPALPGALRVHIVETSVTDSWYEDRWQHAVGAGVGLAIRGDAQTGVSVEIDSVQARRTSGCSVKLRIARDDAGQTIASATGGWTVDFGAGPHAGELTDVEGDIYLSRAFVQPTQMYVKFAVRAKAKGNAVVLMGGVHVVVPTEK